MGGVEFLGGQNFLGEQLLEARKIAGEQLGGRQRALPLRERGVAVRLGRSHPRLGLRLTARVEKIGPARLQRGQSRPTGFDDGPGFPVNAPELARDGSGDDVAVFHPGHAFFIDGHDEGAAADAAGFDGRGARPQADADQGDEQEEAGQRQLASPGGRAGFFGSGRGQGSLVHAEVDAGSVEGFEGTHEIDVG